MRTARFGLLIGYSFLVAGFAWLFIILHFGGSDLGKFGFAIVASLIVFLCSALALAVFAGSVVSAATSLYRDEGSRGVGGYMTVLLSLVSALALGAVYIRGFIIGH